jgi:hypothetical protein
MSLLNYNINKKPGCPGFLFISCCLAACRITNADKGRNALAKCAPSIVILEHPSEFGNCFACFYLAK